MHPAFAGGGSQGAVVDLGLSAGDAQELGAGSGQRLEADQTRRGPAGAGVDGELAFVGADIDDGGETVVSEGGVVVQGGGHAVQQCGPAGGALQELGVFAQTGRHVGGLVLSCFTWVGGRGFRVDSLNAGRILTWNVEWGSSGVSGMIQIRAIVWLSAMGGEDGRTWLDGARRRERWSLWSWWNLARSARGRRDTAERCHESRA